MTDVPAAPDSARPPLDVARLRAACRDHRYIGTRIEVLHEATSTNDECHQAVQRGDAEPGLTVFAEYQTAGRGQHGRGWVAPPRSSLLFSVLVDPPEALATPPFLTAWAAVGITEALQEHLGLDVRIKWPNDIRVVLGGEPHKLAGILVERRRGTVVGVGLNVSVRRAELPEGLRQPACSLVEAAAEARAREPVERTSVATWLLAAFERLWGDALADGPGPMWDRWAQRSEERPGSWRAAITPRGRVVGRLLELRPDSGARLARQNGIVTRVPPEELLRLEPLEQAPG